MENKKMPYKKRWLRVSGIGFGIAILLVAVSFLSESLFPAFQEQEELALKTFSFTAENRAVEVFSSIHEIITVDTIHLHKPKHAIEFTEEDYFTNDPPAFMLDQSVLLTELEKVKADLKIHP